MLNKTEIQDKIKQVFAGKPGKEEIRKIKKLASSKNIKLAENKKKFCKKCCSLFNASNCKIRIKKGFKMIRCECGCISRYKLR